MIKITIVVHIVIAQSRRGEPVKRHQVLFIDC